MRTIDCGYTAFTQHMVLQRECVMEIKSALHYHPQRKNAVNLNRIRGGVGLKSHGMTVAVIPMMCLRNRLCRGML